MKKALPFGWSGSVFDLVVIEVLSDFLENAVELLCGRFLVVAFEKDAVHDFEGRFREVSDFAQEQGFFVVRGLLRVVLVVTLDGVVEVPTGHLFGLAVVGIVEALHHFGNVLFPKVLGAFGNAAPIIREGQAARHGFADFVHRDFAVGKSLVGDFGFREDVVCNVDGLGEFGESLGAVDVVVDGNQAVVLSSVTDRLRDLVFAEEAERGDEELKGAGAIVGVDQADVLADFVLPRTHFHGVTEGDLGEDSRPVAPRTHVHELDVRHVRHVPEDGEGFFVLDWRVVVGKTLPGNDAFGTGLVGADWREGPGRYVNAVHQGERFRHLRLEVEMLALERFVDLVQDCGMIVTHDFTSLFDC